MSSLSLVTPCYNEEKNIRRFIEDWYAELSKKLDDFEIIIVNDCSTDSTPLILHDLAKKFPRLVVINNENNLKYGGTIVRGIKQSSKKYVIWADSDYSHYPADFWKLWEHRENYDAVWGVRSVRQRDTFERSFFTVGNMLLTLLLFQKFLKDPNCAFKLFRREKLLSIIDSIDLHPIMTTTKIAIKAKQMKLFLKEIPVTFLKRSSGMGSIEGFKHISAAFSGLKEMLRFKFTGR